MRKTIIAEFTKSRHIAVDQLLYSAVKLEASQNAAVTNAAVAARPADVDSKASKPTTSPTADPSTAALAYHLDLAALDE
eukprot:1241535-Pleurochrysis_carterae.AAC.2